MKAWLRGSWREWLGDHPWTMFYVVAVTTANLLLSVIETVVR